MSNINTFILSWDCNGLEACFNATTMEQQHIMNILSDSPTSSANNVYRILSGLTLRAKYNTQRHYEIYAIDAEDGISESDITRAFEDNPQGMADIVRRQGRKLYSDRFNPDEAKIV